MVDRATIVDKLVTFRVNVLSPATQADVLMIVPATIAEKLVTCLETAQHGMLEAAVVGDTIPGLATTAVKLVICPETASRPARVLGIAHATTAGRQATSLATAQLGSKNNLAVADVQRCEMHLDASWCRSGYSCNRY
eukprot:m.1637191 g.1637191  ORF g.1637191 m.1637191 type:complete len:137 (-) comp25553_c0_seq1:310-720(-)